MDSIDFVGEWRGKCYSGEHDSSAREVGYELHFDEEVRSLTAKWRDKSIVLESTRNDVEVGTWEKIGFLGLPTFISVVCAFEENAMMFSPSSTNVSLLDKQYTAETRLDFPLSAGNF